MTSGYLGIVFNIIRSVFKQPAFAVKGSDRTLSATQTATPTPGMAKVSFTQKGPSGQVRYVGAEASFDLYWEYGNGDVLANIYVPNADEWEAATKIALAHRSEILHFIGSEAIRQNNGGQGSYALEGNWIVVRA